MKPSELFVLSCVVVGCGSTMETSAPPAAAPTDGAEGGALDGGGRDGDATAPVDAPPCPATSESDLAGAHIVIDSPRCVFTLAEARAGIAIGYRVIIDAAVPGVVARAGDAGNCGAPDGSGLIPFESLAGDGQRYCLCDTGLCAPPSSTPRTLVAGTYAHTFTWDGTNWSGPSDTGNPKGAPFPAGAYTLSVSAAGSATSDGSMTPFTVRGTLAITLVP